MIDLCVIGAGPAGLMAAEVAADHELSVMVVDAKPSYGRKFLMAGKSGLNLTKDEEFETFIAAYDDAEYWLHPMLKAFGNTDVCEWSKTLGQDIFTGSSGRVFPKTMKASPILRAWLLRLSQKNVQFQTRWYWTGWDKNELMFNTANGLEKINARTTVLALGGASWPNLGSDGKWLGILSDEGVDIAPFKPANMGFAINWSEFMKAHFGSPVKTVVLSSGDTSVRADFVISSSGIEGSGVYSVSKNMRDGHSLIVDLLPDTSLEEIERRIKKLPKKSSRSTILRKALRFDATKAALFNEFAHRAKPASFAKIAKSLAIRHDGPRPTQEAISTAGGVLQKSVDKNLMLHCKPSVFCTGEMLNWEAPTGGYLITGCLATGHWAGLGVVQYLKNLR